MFSGSDLGRGRVTEFGAPKVKSNLAQNVLLCKYI